MKIEETEMKTWGEMTDAEKGALLLAHHEGKEIEYGVPRYREFSTAKRPMWDRDLAYRVKNAPVKCNITLGMYFEDGYNLLVRAYMSDPTHKITFDTIDGVPDCSSIKMEKF